MRHDQFSLSRLRVIGLVVVAVLLLVYGIYRVGKMFDVFASRYTLYTLVDDVAGLQEGAPVAIAGQRVGQVSDIDFIPVERKRPGANLIVGLEISERVRDQIRADSRVLLRAQGLLGDKYVDISPGTRGAMVLQPRDTLRSVEHMDIEQFLARSSAVLDSASRAVADMREITSSLARGEGTLGRLITNEELYNRMVVVTGELHSTLRGVNDPNGTFGRLLHDPAMYHRLLAAVTRIDSIGNTILRGRGSLGKLVGSDSLYRSLFSTVTRVDSAAGNFTGFLNRMTTGNGTFQRLATDARLYDEMLRAVVELQTVLAEVRANPKKYVPPIQVKIF